MSTHTSTRRLVAGSAAVALVGGAFAVVTATTPAQAAVAPVFNWEISQQFDGHLSSHTLGDGATEDADGVISFAGGVGSYNPANGAATISYQGSVKGAFNHPATQVQQYAVTLEDPTVVVEGDGSGRISAVVSSVVGTDAAPSDSTAPARVVVTTFDTAGGWDAESLTATPDWDGVMPAGSDEALALGLPADRPIAGRSFAPSFLGQLASGVRAHFYATADPQPNKVPAAFTATANPIATTATITGASYADGLSVSVSGTGFSAVTNPGDAGVYAGIAPAGGLPDVSSQAGMASFAAAAYVVPGQIQASAFTTAMTAETAKLDPTRSYSVYTWRAHTHSTVSQDTETPLTIDWAALKQTATPTPTPTPTATPTPSATPSPTVTATPVAPTVTTTKATVKKLPTTAKGGKLVVKVAGADQVDGEAVVVLKKKGAKKIKRTVTVEDGKVVVKLPKLAPGGYTLTVRFLGADGIEASKTVEKFRVKR